MEGAIFMMAVHGDHSWWLFMVTIHAIARDCSEDLSPMGPPQVSPNVKYLYEHEAMLTFIMVAFRCREKRMSFSLASAISFSKKEARAVQSMDEESITCHHTFISCNSFLFALDAAI